MPTIAQLPGVQFQTVPAQSADRLPRMDVAAFVGFATAGPLHQAVPVEDVVRFREIFGEDLALASDPETGQIEHSFLGPAVEAFFHNGGRRCWIVRVGDEATAAYNRFMLPSVYQAATLNPAWLVARSPGSWADDLQISTQSSHEPIAAAGAILQRVVASTPERLQTLTLGRLATGIQPGELLELRLVARDQQAGLRQLILFLHLGSVSGSERVATLLRQTWFLESTDFQSPAQPESLRAIDAAEATELVRSLERRGPAELVVIGSRVRFAITARRPPAAVQRIGDLGFCAHHPRFWKWLPTDDELFDPSRKHLPSEQRQEPVDLIREAATPRFPLAGEAVPDAGDPEEFFIPLGMPTAAATEFFPANIPSLNALARNGVRSLDLRTFADEQLSGVPTRSLLREAEHKRFIRSENLRGFHAILPIEEVAMVAAPDLVHRPWRPRDPESVDLLEAPRILAIVERSSDGVHVVSWSVVAGATGYQLQFADTVELESSTTIEVSDGTSAILRMPAECPQYYFLRVRALRDQQHGPWSETRAMRFPTRQFIGCDHTPPVQLEVRLEITPAESWSEGWELRWSTREPHAGGEVELQESHDVDFSLPTTLAVGAAPPYPLPASDAVSYYRVRLQRNAPWSNTVAVVPTRRGEPVLEPSSAYLHDDLVSIHQALLRFCAAREDVLAVLALPRHFQVHDVSRYLERLVEPSPPMALTDVELSFGAMYHPWVATRSNVSQPPAGVETSFRPPEGAVCGTMALRANQQGAWIAPANTPLTNVLALDGRFDRAAWSTLFHLHVNLLRDDPRGFLVLGANTLSHKFEVELINVRRLLILIRRIVLRDGQTFVFEPNHFDFRNQVRHRFEQILSDLYTRGAFAGRDPASAFQVVIDERGNARQVIERGQFVIELRIAPSRPTAFLHIRLVQSGPDQLTFEET